MDVTLVLRAAAPDRLEQMGAALLRGETPAEVGDRAALRTSLDSSLRDVDEVRRFAYEHRLTVTDVHPARNTVLVRGAQIDVRRVFANAAPRDVTVPRELVGVVDAVILSDDTQVAGHSSSRTSQLASRHFTPRQVAGLYRFPAGSGAGQTIGIVAFAGRVDRRDVESYLADLGIEAAPEVVTVPVDGGAEVLRSWRTERYELMDNVEVVAAVAPAARIVVYLAPNTTAGFVNALSTAVHDEIHRPSVISVSWGRAEPLWAPRVLTAVDRVLRAAALLGITVLCASGDFGSSDGVEDGYPHVDFPASSPFALACGGSSLRELPGGTYREAAWQSSGGGVSERFTMPAYQRGFAVPLRPGPATLRGRGVPDVAGHADLAAGYRLLADGRARLVGGTSAVAPLYAGLIAIVNQRARRQVGFVNGLLYQQAGDRPICRDIDRGCNGAYHARRGWDPCTGLGSVDGGALLKRIMRKPS